MGTVYALRMANTARDWYVGCVTIQGEIIPALMREGILSDAVEYTVADKIDYTIVTTRHGDPVLFLFPKLPYMRTVKTFIQGGCYGIESVYC